MAELHQMYREFKILETDTMPDANTYDFSDEALTSRAKNTIQNLITSYMNDGWKIQGSLNVTYEGRYTCDGHWFNLIRYSQSIFLEETIEMHQERLQREEKRRKEDEELIREYREKKKRQQEEKIREEQEKLKREQEEQKRREEEWKKSAPEREEKRRKAEEERIKYNEEMRILHEKRAREAEYQEMLRISATYTFTETVLLPSDGAYGASAWIRPKGIAVTWKGQTGYESKCILPEGLRGSYKNGKIPFLDCCPKCDKMVEGNFENRNGRSTNIIVEFRCPTGCYQYREGTHILQGDIWDPKDPDGSIAKEKERQQKQKALQEQINLLQSQLQTI